MLDRCLSIIIERHQPCIHVIIFRCSTRYNTHLMMSSQVVNAFIMNHSTTKDANDDNLRVHLHELIGNADVRLLAWMLYGCRRSVCPCSIGSILATARSGHRLAITTVDGFHGKKRIWRPAPVSPSPWWAV